MPFTDAVSSVSGRNSRASNVSGMTGASRSIRSGPPPNDTLSNVGVLSMLKTSTDTGDIGALSFNTNRLPSMPRAAHPRRGHSSRPSESSHGYPGSNSHHNYAPSQASKFSDSTSLQRRGSFTSMQSIPPSLPPGNTGKMPQIPPPAFDKSRDSRSYSLTSAPANQQLPRHRSATSLKSAGHEPRQVPRTHPGNPPSMPEHRPPYVYPTRLKRPGYRSPSPALSDLSSQGLPPIPPPGARRAPLPPRPQPQTYNSDYGADYGHDPRYLNSRAPWNNLHAMPYDPNQYGYRQAPARPGQGIPPMPPMPPQHQPAHYGPPRPPYAGPHYGQRPGYPPYPPMQYPGHPNPGSRGPPPPASMAPVAHSMFHNAARMARSLPQRSDTPMTDTGPPSSDPPSSGTMPSSSSPPTPKDSTTIQVAVDPLFIDPALTDLPDSSSEPVLPHKYFEYADGLHKPIDEPEIEVHHPSVPPTGFVQRVRAMLESKAAVDQEAERQRVHAAQYDELIVEEETELELSELHELAANETPRFTIIEEYEAPVELPASPVRLPELADSPVSLKQRITREMVKAELGPSSTANSTQIESGGDTSLEVEVQLVTTEPQQPHLRDASGPVAGTPKARHTIERPHATPANRQQRKKSIAESAITASPEPLAISGIDYALRFSVPMDTTNMPEEETQSRDPFILDADTITLEHQRSKEKMTASNFKNDERKSTELFPEIKVPVSPLQLGETNNRSSAVSPLHTQTLGIDETLRLAAESTQDSSDVDQSLLGSSPEGSPPPLTPRTPRTYSKSVQLPAPSVTATDTPTSNRFSLPPDLSNVGETTVHSTTDMITDVAVRFSLPNTTITIGKPQIVTIPPSSSPEKQESSPPKIKAQGLDPKTARRSSVTFADQVAPLNIKKVDPRNESQSSKETAVVKGKSIIRRLSPLDDISESSRASRDSTTDLRFPANNVTVNSRFGSTHLPGLKEESVEDMSISDQKRSSDIAGGFQFPLPARIAAVKAMQERRLQESAEKAKARRSARNRNRPLAEARDLPSLNFSSMDLIDKLNAALETDGPRPTKSMEIIRRRDFSAIYCPSPQRPQSTEPLRERYTSFFSKPEDFSQFEELSDSELDDSTVLDIGVEIPAVEVQESTEIEEVPSDQIDRPLSPEDLLSVATQVNRLSIPSVTGLSERLSELLPSLKNLHLDHILSTDADVAHTIDDIHHLGHGPRPDTVLSNRTSAGFRTLAERAEDIVLHGTHDSMIVGSKLLLGSNKELPPLPESASADKVSALTSVDEKQPYLSGSVSAPTDLGLPRPSSALVRHKSPMTEEEVLQMLPPESNPIARGAKRSLMLSGASTRPWNQDENYPWSGSNLAIDLSVPSEAHTRDSITGNLIRVGRRSKSMDFTSSGEATDTIRGIDIGSLTTLNRSASVTTEQATGVPAHTRKQSKLSIIGSISKKIGLPSRITAAIDDSTRNTSSPAQREGRESIPHRPGDRYPTSALTPPANFNLDEVRSFFSDDSSERQRNASMRKRFTNFKTGKGKSVRLDPTVRGGGHSLDVAAGGETGYDAGSMAAGEQHHRLGATSSAHTYDAGMGKAEFRIKRFGEKLRHLIAKGGELIRSWSTKSSRAPREARVRDDWLSDSLYSGV